MRTRPRPHATGRPTNLTLRWALRAALGSLLVTAPAGQATAEPEAPTAAAAANGAVEHVTVYGSRTTNTLDDTLSSVGIVSLDDIKDLDLRSFREAFRTLGNVMDSDWSDGGFIIRGVNSEGLTPGGNPLASLYIDGAQQTVNGARRGARGVWDVEQIEVYRGPQSTLSGRAALAGAIYIKTRDPEFEWGGSLRGIAGTDDLVNGAVAFGGPLIEEQLAFRVAAEYENSEFDDISYPTYEGFNRYNDYVEDEYHQIRAKLLYVPESLPDTRVLLTYSTAEDSPAPRDIAGPVLGFNYSERRGDVNLPVYAEPRSAETDNVTLEVNHALDGGWRFTSLTTWSESDTERPSINAGTPGETEVTVGDQYQELVTQELRLNYNGEQLDAVFGVYFADEDVALQSERNAFGRLDVSRGGRDSENYALFGEVTWRFADNWRAIAGGRGDYTDQEDYRFFSRNGVVSTDQVSSFDESVFLPKLGIAFDIDPDQTMGFIAQQGFRTGGAGVQASSGREFEFDAEYTWNYELSYKGSFDGGRLSIAANIFYTDWEDQQVELQEVPLDFASTITVNAASSEVYGFELESRYQFSEGLSGFASIGYVKSEFSDFSDASVGDLSGFPFPESPEWNLAIGGRYEFGAGFYLGADAKYLDDYLARIGSPPQDYLDSYWIANAQAGWRSDKWEVSVFAENLFDEDYFVYNDSNAEGDIAATLGEPQRIGVSATYHF